jgi:predicted permease
MDSIHRAVRSLARSPAFSIVTIHTLALGVATTTAVVSVVDHVLLRSLPFRDAGRLVMLFERDQQGALRIPSAPTARDWRSDPGARTAFEDIAFIRGDGVLLGVGESAERGAAAYVGPEFFPLIGARPLLGRTLVADDHRAGAPPAVVLAFELWRRRFGGDPSILGKTIAVDSVPATIVGVMPNGATYPDFASVWESVTQYRHQEILTRRGLHADSRTIGRLRAGIDSAQAVSALRSIEARLGQAYPADQARWSGAMLPLRTAIIGNVSPMLLTLAGAAVVVLLLACANVGGLLLVRLSTRGRELAVRSALGASRARLVRHLLGESAVLAAAGGALGTLLAAFAVDLARALPSTRLPRVQELAVDGRVLLVGVAASAVTLVVFGVWPALRATSASMTEPLRAGVLGSVGVRAESRARRALVVAQFALALVLLVGAGLLLQSFRRAATVDAGFDPTGVVTVRISPGNGYQKPQDAAALYQRLIDAARAVPGVVDAAFINHVPFGGASITTSVEIEGRSGADTSSNQIFYRTVSDSYARTMRLSMLAGRWFDAGDIRSPGGTFVINETMAKQYWPGASAVGKRIVVRRASQARADFGQPISGTVIGVIHDVHQAGLDVPPDPEVYVPYTLETWPWGSLVIRVRSREQALPALGKAIAAVDPSLLPAGAAGANAFGSLDQAIAATLESRKLPMTLVVAFAACALLLAAIGLYGVIAYTVAQRRRELGVRKALGATDRMIGGLVMRESLELTALGVVLGCGGAWATARLIRGLLYDTGTADPVAYSVTIVLLIGVAVTASWLPARRATKLDPMEAIRGE